MPHISPEVLSLITSRFEPKLVSLVRFPRPFLGDGLLITLNDNADDFVGLATAIRRLAPKRLSAICLKRSELYQLAMPNPYAIETLSTPYWVRNAGTLLWGDDIRSEVPLYKHPNRLLAFHLEKTIHRTRNHFILALLAADRYRDIHVGLARKRTQLMATALLAKSIWEVYPSTISQIFLDAYNTKDFRDILTDSNKLLLEAQGGRPSPSWLKHSAYRSVWLFEMFIRGLWRYAK